MKKIPTSARALVRRYHDCRREHGPQSAAALQLAQLLADRASDDCDWRKAGLWFGRMLDPADGAALAGNARNYLRLSHALRQLCALRLREKNYAQAQAYAQRDLELVGKYAGPDHELTATSLENLADLAEATGDRPAARAWRERLVAVLQRNYGDRDPRVKFARAQLQSGS